ncbi:TPA: hypothetical protein ACH3X1_009580 [Trebouxia sp. C0004]
MLRQIKRCGYSKADFYLPPAMEKVAKIFADHLSKSNVVNIQAELAATTLRETLDNDFATPWTCQCLLLPRNTILAAGPSGSRHYPQQAMHHGRATGLAPELCKEFARGHCRFGNTCCYLHELSMPPPAARASQAPAQQKLQAASLPEPPTQKPPIPAGPELLEALTNHSQAVADMPPLSLSMQETADMAGWLDSDPFAGPWHLQAPQDAHHMHDMLSRGVGMPWKLSNPLYTAAGEYAEKDAAWAQVTCVHIRAAHYKQNLDVVKRMLTRAVGADNVTIVTPNSRS